MLSCEQTGQHTLTNGISGSAQTKAQGRRGLFELLHWTRLRTHQRETHGTKTEHNRISMRLSTTEYGGQDGYHFQERAFQQWIKSRHYGAAELMLDIGPLPHQAQTGPVR